MEEITRFEGNVPLDREPAAAIFATSAGDDDDAPLTRAAYTAIRREETETRGMKGATPKTFNGDRKDSERFIEEFDIFWEVNRDNKTMKEPYSRILMLLSYLKGDKIKNWRRMQLAKIRKSTREEGVDMNDEDLWKDFVSDFKTAFTNTTEKQDAYVKLKDLRMTSGDLDQYIADHENLAFLAEWPEEDHGAIESFVEGLSPGLRLAILKRDDVPTTYESWKKAAKKEQAKWSLIKSSGLLRGGKSTNRQDRWKAALSGKGGGQSKTRDPDAMDVDNVRLNPLTPEERKTLMTEGRCFRCRKQGHLSKQCPNNSGKQESAAKVNTTEAKTKAKSKERAPEVVDDREDPSDAESEQTAVTERSEKRSTARVNKARMMPDDFVKILAKYTQEERDAVVEAVMMRGPDF